MSFDKAFTIVVALEGGYVNDPSDPGGETKFGISRRSHPDIDILHLTREQARSIFLADYWAAAHCDEIPWPLSLYVFDAAVNQGVSAAIRMLQARLRVREDGGFGPVTLAAALRMARSEEFGDMYMAERALRYARTAQFDLYGLGWMRRLFSVARSA